MMNDACIRPLAEQKAAKRDSFIPKSATSLVSWPCRKEAASAPVTRITPKWLRVATPEGNCMGKSVFCVLSGFIGELSSSIEELICNSLILSINPVN